MPYRNENLDYDNRRYGDVFLDVGGFLASAYLRWSDNLQRHDPEPDDTAVEVTEPDAGWTPYVEAEWNECWHLAVAAEEITPECDPTPADPDDDLEIDEDDDVDHGSETVH